MYRCERCKRPMKQNTGLGPKCRLIVKAKSAEADLFGPGVDLDRSERCARASVQAVIARAVAEVNLETARLVAAKLRQRLEALA